jgi:hypothetical protein
MLTTQDKVTRAAALIESAKVDLDNASAVSIVLFHTANRAMEKNDFAAAAFFYHLARQD